MYRLLTVLAGILVFGMSTSALAQGQGGPQFTFVEMNDRNATTKGANGFAVIGLSNDPKLPPGIIAENTVQAFKLKPDHDYYEFMLVQLAGPFGEPGLQLPPPQPNKFRATLRTDSGGHFVSFGYSPGPGAALAPGTYRVDLVVTDTEVTFPPSTEQGDLIMERLGTLAGQATEPLLTSERFYTGIVLTVPEE